MVIMARARIPGLTQDTSGDLDEHWMATGRRDDQALPVTVLARWRWYKSASRRDRYSYYLMEMITVIVSAAVPVAAAAHLSSTIVATLGAIVLIATGFRTTFGLHENWVEHSQVGYAIEREAALFLVASPPYDAVDAAQLLVVRVEGLADEGGQRWTRRRMGVDHAQQAAKGPRTTNNPL